MIHLTSEEFQNKVSNGLAKEIVQELRTTGFAQVPNFLSQETIRSAEQYIEDESKRRNELNFSLREKELKDSIVAKLAHDPPASQLMDEISHQMGFKTHKEKYYARMRAKLGYEPSVDELDFHFDGSFLTYTIPIVVPKKEDGGGLLIYPKARKFSMNPWHNRLTRRYYASSLFGGKKLEHSKKVQEIFYEPNSLFIFEGFTTLHATGRMNENAKRIVVLIHSGDIKLK